MSAEARAVLEQSKEGQQFLEVVKKCSEPQLVAALIVAGAKLVTARPSGKENVPSQNVPDASSALVTLKNLTLINPRGKFELLFSKEAVVVTNAKTTLVVPMKLITHVAVLDEIPSDTKKAVLLFFVLDRNGPPVLNGKQRLEAIIIKTLESDTSSVTATTGHLLEGPTASVLCQAVGLCKDNFGEFLAPDPDFYRTRKGHTAVHAVVKVAPGHLFPLRGAVLFVEKPAIFVAHSDLLAVEYRRPQSATFDLVLHTRPKTGEGEAIQQVEFSQIDQAELSHLQRYFAACNIRPYDPAAPPQLAPAGSQEEADEDDEDEDEDDDDFDPTDLERREAAAQGSSAARSMGRPSKRQRTGPSGSVAASSSPDDEGDDDEEEEGEEESSNEDDDSDDDDELEDLTDEEDLRADVVRQRVLGTGAGGSKESGRGRKVREEEEEEEVEEDDDE